MLDKTSTSQLWEIILEFFQIQTVFPSLRVLKVFLSRTAQRTPYMTSWRVLRLLAVILLIVLWFLVAWTSAVCQSPELSRSLIVAGFTPEGMQFSMCLLDRWDYMMGVGECVCGVFLLLFSFGSLVKRKVIDWVKSVTLTSMPASQL